MSAAFDHVLIGKCPRTRGDRPDLYQIGMRPWTWCPRTRGDRPSHEDKPLQKADSWEVPPHTRG